VVVLGNDEDLKVYQVLNVWIEDIVVLEIGEVNYLGLGLEVFKKKYNWN